ncbi:hypothetical protein FHG87_015138 [Trinorchestia longiramus]|nr:hypothetical protein FHG87_015138 [Trinorchestia longiramus]
MCSQSTFVKDLLLRRLSRSENSPAPVTPAEKKETVQSMVRRRVIGLDRSNMVDVNEDQKNNSCSGKQTPGKYQKPNFCSIDNGSFPHAGVGCQTSVPKRGNNSSNNEAIFTATSADCGHQSSGASLLVEMADDAETSQFLESDEVDGSCKRVDDLLEENDAFARLLDMMDGFPANNEGASALRVLCTLDQGTIASLLSNKTLHWTPAGKMILRIFKQQDEPLLPAPVQRAFETRADDDERMCSDVPPCGRPSTRRESSSGAPAGTEPIINFTGFESCPSFANSVNSSNPNINITSLCDTSEEFVTLPVAENLPCEVLDSQINESNEEQATFSNIKNDMINLNGCQQTELFQNSRVSTFFYNNHNFCDSIPLDSTISPSISSNSGYLTPSLQDDLSVPDISTSGCSSIARSASDFPHYSDANVGVSSVGVATNSVVSFKKSRSIAEDYLGHQPELPRSIQKDCTMRTVDESEAMQQTPSGIMTQKSSRTANKGAVIFEEKPNEFLSCQSNAGEVHDVPVATPTARAAYETKDRLYPSFSSEPVSHVPKEQNNLIIIQTHETIMGVTNSSDGFNSPTSLQSYLLPMYSPNVEAANQQSWKLKCCRGKKQVQNFRFSSHDTPRRPSQSACNHSSSKVGSVSSIAFEECELPEPQDTCQSNQLTQEEFEAINGDGSGPIMLQILP